MDEENIEINYSYIRDDEHFASLFRDTTEAEVIEMAMSVDNNDEDEHAQRELEIALEQSNKAKEREERKKVKDERRKVKEERNKKKEAKLQEEIEQQKKNQQAIENSKLKELKALQEKKLQPTDKDILVIILDHDAQQPYLRRNPDVFCQVINAVTMLCNAHLLGRSDNELAFIGCSRFSVNLHQPDTIRLRLRCLEDPLDASDFTDFITKAKIYQQMHEDYDKVADNSDQKDQLFSLLAGGIGKALCYIQRRRREIKQNAANGVPIRVVARILIVTGTDPPSHLYTNYINIINGAKTAEVPLDVCVLDRNETSHIWRQATDVTGGFYYSTRDFENLLTHLLSIFLISPVERFQFNYPDQPPVDTRPCCVCHRMVLDIGFVCSVCLSVHCRYSPICRVCDSLFKPPKSLEEFIKRKKLRRRSTSF